VRELLRSNEIVFLSWADALLKSEDIEIFVLDGHMSVLEGSAGAILRRVMVADEDYDRAKRVLEDAGEGDRVV
jgi:integrase